MKEQNKYLVVGKEPSDIDYNLKFYGSNRVNVVWAETENLALRTFNHYHRDDNIEGIVVAKYKDSYDKEERKQLDEVLNGFSLIEALDIKSYAIDHNIAGPYGDLDASWELSDLSIDGKFIPVEEYLPEDLCTRLYTGYDFRYLGGKDTSSESFTKDCICKFDDGTMKFAHRKSINPNNQDEIEEWIEEWSRRQLKNAKGIHDMMYLGCGGVGPAYHWVMPKSYADRVISWRWFKEREKRYLYM